jgi:hypothetical protein
MPPAISYGGENSSDQNAPVSHSELKPNHGALPHVGGMVRSYASPSGSQAAGGRAASGAFLMAGAHDMNSSTRPVLSDQDSHHVDSFGQSTPYSQPPIPAHVGSQLSHPELSSAISGQTQSQHPQNPPPVGLTSAGSHLPQPELNLLPPDQTSHHSLVRSPSARSSSKESPDPSNGPFERSSIQPQPSVPTFLSENPSSYASSPEPSNPSGPAAPPSSVPASSNGKRQPPFRFSEQQRAVLEKDARINMYPSLIHRQTLAQDIGVPIKKVSVNNPMIRLLEQRLIFGQAILPKCTSWKLCICKGFEGSTEQVWKQ